MRVINLIVYIFIQYVFSAIDPSIHSLSLYSLESMASAAPSVHTTYSKGSKWSHAKPEPLSTDVKPTLRELTLTRRHVETTDQTSLDDVLPANNTAPGRSGNSSLSLQIYSLDELTGTAKNQNK
mgnify:CR=1 FL=1